jgi:quinol monooxygenase YgiN
LSLTQTLQKVRPSRNYIINTSCEISGLVSWGACRFAAAAGNVAADEPLYVVTHVDVMPKFTDAGRELLKQFAAESREDTGAVRIEVLEELGPPNHSTIVEIWANRQAYEDHLATDHTKAYRAKLEPMLGSPFDERLHRLSLTDADR